VARSRALPFPLLRQVARCPTSTVIANRQASISGVLVIATIGQDTTMCYMYIVNNSTHRPPTPEGALLTCHWLHSSGRLTAAYFQPCVVDLPSPARRSCSMQPQICSMHARLIDGLMSGIHNCWAHWKVLSFQNQPMRKQRIDSASAEACCHEAFVGDLHGTSISSRDFA
jgi:hypothetical protein